MLSRALEAVQGLAAGGEARVSALVDAARRVISSEPAVRVDYIAAVDWATLEPVELLVQGGLFAIAAYVGTTRLIDNFVAE